MGGLIAFRLYHPPTEQVRRLGRQSLKGNKPSRPKPASAKLKKYKQIVVGQLESTAGQYKG